MVALLVLLFPNDNNCKKSVGYNKIIHAQLLITVQSKLPLAIIILTMTKIC